MIIKINQTKANLKENYDVIIDDQLAYTGLASWVSALCSTKLLDQNGDLILESHFLPFEELKNSIPFKWTWSERQTENHAVFDRGNKPIGLFYLAAQGLKGELSEKRIVKYGNYELSLYPINKGRNQYTPIFLGDTQIGQLDKDGFVEDNKDWYRLYLLDEYRDLAPILSLFVIYYDSYEYGNQGEVVAYSSDIHYEWTYSKYKKLYDPSWLPAHFKPVDDSKMLAQMSERFRKRVIVTLSIVFGGMALLAIVFVILWVAGAWPH